MSFGWLSQTLWWCFWLVAYRNCTDQKDISWKMFSSFGLHSSATGKALGESSSFHFPSSIFFSWSNRFGLPKFACTTRTFYLKLWGQAHWNSFNYFFNWCFRLELTKWRITVGFGAVNLVRRYDVHSLFFKQELLGWRNWFLRRKALHDFWRFHCFLRNLKTFL